MINKQVMKDWQQQNKSTIQRKYQKIKEKRKFSKNMLSQEEAAYICASDDGVDLHKHLNKDTVEKIRQLSINYNPTTMINNNSGDRNHSNSKDKKVQQEKVQRLKHQEDGFQLMLLMVASVMWKTKKQKPMLK